MAASALVAVEAQLASAAHRHLQVSFGRSVLTTRGDGWVLFQLPAAQHRADEDAESSFAAEMQRLISALAREVTNHTSLTLSGEAEASNFSTITDRALNFSTLIARYSELGSLPADYAALPNTATIQQMLELLYKEVAADLSTGVHAITNFPSVLCPTGTRFDVVVKKAVCVRAYSSTTVDLRPGRDRAESATPAVSPRKRQLQKQRDELAMEDSSLLVSVASLDRKMLDGPMLKVWINTHELAQALSTFSTASLESELPPQWRSKTFSLAEGAEVLRLVHTSLMEYWASKPHTERTRTNCISLLSIVSGDLREYIRSQVLLQSSDWRGPWRMALADLQAALHLCRKWKKMLNLLQRRDWQEWESGEAFQDESFLLFSQRLQDAVRIRETLQSITQLHEKIPDSLVPEIIFEDANMMDLSSPTWDTCVAAFEKELSFLTPSLRNRVKQLFTGPPGDSQLRVVEQYTTLLRREDIGSAVGKELDAVAEYLVQKLATVASRYENNVRRATTDLQRLRASKTCQAEGSYVPEVAYQLFGPDSERTTLVAKRAEGIIVAAQKEEVSVMEQWRNTVEAQCKKIKEVEEAAVIQTIDGERLTCTVHQSIQQFLQEVRNIRCWISGASSYSANPSRKDMSKLSDGAENTIKACELLVAAAIRMQQTVANFNTVLHQIIPCTRPMLDPAVKKALSHILFADTPRRTISLGNYQELEGLILSFQNTVESLSADNRHIRRFHGDFISQVLALHNVDLTKHMDQWRSAVDGMRSSFEDFLTQHNFANYDRWRRHWDAQIFKALEYQYRKGLESLHENMEELKVELVFKQGVVQFKPTFEAMREAYYVKVREFVSVPLRFRGLQPKREGNGTYELYPLMPVLNNERIITVHTKAIELFTKLNRVRKAFRQHIVIGLCGMNGSPDLDSIVEQWANTDEQFGRGFEVVKEHLAKMQKIEDVMKVDCFSISTVPVKASMEEQLHRLEESLLNALRKRMQVAVNAVDEFIFNASNVVERQPTTMDEVGKANQAYHEYLGQLGDFEKQLEQIDINNKDLRARSGAAIDLSATKTRWEHLRDAMSSHTKVIEASVSKMRVSLDSIIQKFLKDIQRFANNWSKQKNLLLDAFRDKKPEAVQRLLVVMKDLVNDLHDLEKQATELESKCAYFNQPKPNFTVLASTVKDVTSTSAMWSLYDQFEEKLGELRREDWLTFRSHTYQFDDFCKEWNQTLAQRTSEGGDGNASENIIATYLLNMLVEWNAVLPLLKFCRGDGWMTEHWNELFRLLEIPKGMTSAELTFGDVLEHYTQLLEKQAEVKQLHSRAQGEIQIREALQDLRTWALEANFTLVAPNDGAGKIKLISEWKDVMTQVSENQALVGSLKDSPFYANFADEAAGWESKLIALSESLILLNSIQRRWAYLEPIFARGALPQEQARFKRVDKEFVSILREVEADPRVMSLAAQIDLADKLKGILEQIERCQKSLMEYLDTKRDKLPRFYFISDEDLLEILGHSQNPSVIQSHLKKLFMGIHSVEFNEDKTSITHMLSADHERVQLLRPVNITGPNVEDWLIQLDEVMKATLQELIVKCVGVKDPTSMECVRIYPSQVLQVAQQILATSMIHDSISRNTLKEVHGILNNQLSHLTSASASEDEVTKLKIKALILDVIHNVEVVELLMAKQVRDPREWWWQKQLRYTLDDKQLCHIHMIDTTFAYTYEYQGNAAKLVHTPLTDKCYLVLTKGMGLGYGGNPYGPAGTGKTESVKALGSAMGRQVLVFNCDEGIDFKAMGRIFVGIVKCGAWGCFDEFNRLKIDQLSAISQMIQVIQEALKNKEPTCPLLNKAVDLNPNAGIFVTLNPAGKGYGGRTKLPDNLKQLFREVAMSVPDNELITSTMLLSEGFVHAKKLATNVVQLYKLCGQLMSTQQHYDWGLRPLKAVLRLGGSLVQRWKANAPGKTATEMEEAELMIQSLNINTISKLTFDDARLFRGLVRDIFPGAKTTEISYVELEDAVKKAIHELGLQEIPAQVLKVLQLYEAMNQRTGVVLVGPSGSGKSTLINILRKALEMMKIAVPLHVMNPKAMPRRQLLGFMDPDTREWYDGVLTAAARDVVKQPKESRPWILCDGDIDPEWIESLNSVLDDNKLLTMPNGVRIQFGANVNFVFETHSLEYASPATVSRMGVLFFSDKDIYLESVVESVMAAQSERVRTNIQPLILKHVFAAIDEVLRLNTFSVPTTRMGLLQTCLNHVMQVKNEGDFIHSMVRGLGGTMTPEGAVTFANAIYAAAPQKPLNESRPLDTYYDAKAKKMAEFSSDLTATITPAELLAGHAPMIKTAEIQRLLATLAPLARDKSCKPVFLVGPEGCGKGKLLKHSLKTEEGVGITIINCSAQTSSVNVVQKLEQLCTLYSTNTGRVFRPKDGERLVLIFRNINLPKPDRYGTVELHSFIHQLLMYQGFYNKELEFIRVERIQIMASMNPATSAGRYPVTPRLLAIVNIITMAYPSKSSLLQIYTTYWAGLLRSTNIGQGKDYDGGRELAQFMITVYDKIRRRFEGEDYAHFLICPRHLTSWLCNVLLYQVDALTSLPAVLANEAYRIFSDCLPHPEDRSKADKIFTEHLAAIGFSAPSRSERYAMMFVSWFRPLTANEGEPRLLEQKKYEDIAQEVQGALLRYSREFKELDITVIAEVISWIARVDRVLARPGGHLILVGRPGVGRRDATILAAYMQRMEFVTLNMTHDYSIKNFRNDLRTFIQRATTQNTRMLLVLEDHNIIDESFLEYINGLVSSGEAPGLFTSEEMENMYSSIREEAANDGYIGNIYGYFVDRLQKNFRVALIMDNQHELFLVRLQSNPGLLTKCELLWMGMWSDDVAKTVCKTRLKDKIAALESSDGNKGFHLHREMLAIHHGMGPRYSPKDFQVLMDSYDKIIDGKSKSSDENIERLEAGLAKLMEAESSVEKIKRDVAKKKGDCETMQKEADEALNKIQKSMEDSQEQRDQAKELQQQLKEEHEDIVQKRHKSEEELKDIKPMLDTAKDAVSSIQSEQLNEIRSLKSPPEPIRDVLEGVMALLGVTDVSWQSMRKFLGERGMKDRILDFKVDTITPAIRSSVSKLVQQKATSFKHEVIFHASKAAAPMAQWVTAMIKYADITERIAPLTRQLEQLERNQREGEEKLKALNKKLKEIDELVATLREEFTKKCKEAEKLRAKLEAAEKELHCAHELLGKLSGEKTRWAQEAETIREAKRTVPKRALIAAAFMTYLGRETEDVRLKYVSQWSERLGFTSPVDVTDFMSTEGERLQYKAEGLPGDQLSMENAVVLLGTVQTPLVIDPANQAIEWCKAHLRASNVVVEVASLHDERFAHTLELAIRFGKTLLVTEVSAIEALLFPVLRRDLTSAGAKRVVQVGNKSVDWQDTFRTILFTRSTDLSLPPGAAALVSEINFSVTSFGLESQLLGLTIKNEKPELEQQKVELLRKEEGLKLDLSKLEVRLLSELANAHGDILENTQLVESLNEVKMQSTSIQEALSLSQVLQTELDEKRDVYRPFARQGSVLYFLIKDLARLNRMYQFGLADFIDLFTATLKGYHGAQELQVKIPELIGSFARAAFHRVCQGLFKQDRMIFGLHLLHGFHPEEYPAEAWDCLMGAVANVKSVEEVSLPAWAPPSSKVKFAALLATPTGAAAVEKWRLDNLDKWTKWMSSSSPEQHLASKGSFTTMEQLLLINTFRPDRMPALTLRIILESLKVDSLIPPTTMEELLKSSSASTPLLLITSSGADPSMEVQAVANHVVGKQRFTQMALGGGQTDEAMQQLRRCAAQGEWLFLKNLHLVLDWAHTLEKELCAMPEPNPGFRLIITTEAHDLFPSVLLRISTKVTVEAPPGVKQNLLRTYGSWDQAFLESMPQNGAQMLFGLAFFHSIVQERRTFVPQGWVQYYEFSPADLKAASDVLIDLSRKKSVDWVTLKGILENCIYGGRLDNPRDERVLQQLMDLYFTEEVIIRTSSPLYGNIMVPATGNRAAILPVIQQQIADVDVPAIFNLPPNADRAVLESAAGAQVEALRGLTKHTATHQGSLEGWHKLLAPALELWKASDLKVGGPPRSIASNVADPDPIDVFFVSEVNLLAQLIIQLTAWFDDLRSMSEGTMIPSAEMRDEALELIGGRMPSRWLDRMDGPKESKLWLSLLARKYQTTLKWMKEPMSASIVYDLSSFLRPQTFFNALRQYTARQSKAPLVDLMLVASIGSSGIANSLQVSVSVKATSIVIQGAIIAPDGKVQRVSASSPSSVPLSTNIVVGWMSGDRAASKMSGYTTIPVYSNAERQTVVFPLCVPCASPSEELELSLNGVACFLVPS